MARRGPDPSKTNPNAPRRGQKSTKQKKTDAEFEAMVKGNAARTAPDTGAVSRNPGIPAALPSEVPGNVVQPNGTVTRDWRDPVGAALAKGPSVDPSMLAKYMAAVGTQSPSSTAYPSGPVNPNAAYAAARDFMANQPKAPLTPLEEYQAGRAPIELSSYLAPFTAAADGAQKAFAAATPAITQNYKELDGQLVSGAADAQAQSARNREALVAQLAASKGELAGFAQQAQGGPMVSDPTLASRGAATTAGLQASQAANADSRLALADRLAQVQAQSDAGRRSDAGLAKEAALSTAATNLQQLLNGIETGKAGAAQQFAKDTEARRYQDFQMQQQQASTDAATVAKQAAAADKHTSEVNKLYTGAMTTAKQELERTWADKVVSNPGATAAFERVVGGSMVDPTTGKNVKIVTAPGARGYAQAKAWLESNREALASGQNPSGKKLNVDTIDEWLKAHYNIDPTKRLSERARAEVDAQIHG